MQRYNWSQGRIALQARCRMLETDWSFFFQAEDGIRDLIVTGVQTCALPIFADQHPDDGVTLLPDRHLVRLQQLSAGLGAFVLARQVHPEEKSAHLGSGLPLPELVRSEERRVGKECRSRWSPYH